MVERLSMVETGIHQTDLMNIGQMMKLISTNYVETNTFTRKRGDNPIIYHVSFMV